MLEANIPVGTLTVITLTANALEVALHPAGVVTVKLYEPVAVAV